MVSVSNSAGGSGSDWILESLDEVPFLKTPARCEIWNWQGDTSILPFKFESVLNSASIENEAYSHTDLKKQYIEDSRFDPMGFFFLTSHSSAIGLTLALPLSDDPDTYEIPFLVCVPEYKDKGVV